MRPPLERLIEALEAVAAVYEEVYDTDVREQMAEAIVRGLTENEFEPPAEYGMFSAEANQLVREAVSSYLATARPTADSLELDGEARLRAVWDADARSASGTGVDEFLGWID